MNSILDLNDFRILNNIVYDLYNSDVLLHNRIVNFLSDTMQLVYFDKATILFFYKDKNNVYTKHSSISLNWESKNEMVKLYNNYYCHVDDTLPIFDQQNPIIFRANSFFNPEARKENAYWMEYLIPNNCFYSLEGNLQIKNPYLRAGFNFYRGREKNDFSEKDVAIISLLQPHLSNVLKDYGKEADSTSLFFTLENHDCVGIAIFDSNYSIVRSNSKYRALVSCMTNNETGSNFLTTKIITLCTKLSTSKDIMSNNPYIEYKFEDFPIYITVSMLPSQSKDSGTKFSCMIYDLSYFYKKSLDQTKEKYMLTEREFDILKMVLKGKSNEEIAAELYLSLPTVKKYLASIYNKMNIKSQKQILTKLSMQEG